MEKDKKDDDGVSFNKVVEEICRWGKIVTRTAEHILETDPKKKKDKE